MLANIYLFLSPAFTVCFWKSCSQSRKLVTVFIHWFFSTKFISTKSERELFVRFWWACKKKTKREENELHGKSNEPLLWREVPQKNWRAKQFCVNFPLLCCSWAFASFIPLFFLLKICAFIVSYHWHLQTVDQSNQFMLSWFDECSNKNNNNNQIRPTYCWKSLMLSKCIEVEFQPKMTTKNL